MKKILSVILAMVMIFSIGSVAAFAADSYEIIFTDCPYDVSSYRSDYIGKYVGYEYGTDFWFTITNEDGTTTDIKGFPYSVFVDAGDSLEFVVNIADHVEPTSVRMLAYPSGMDVAGLYNAGTGEPDSKYYISKSVGDTYGLKPSEDLTVCISEYHLFNDCFLFDFPASDFYTATRLFLTDPDATNPWDRFTTSEWGNTEVIYLEETIYFSVSIPLDGAYDYHYDTYQVYYVDENGETQYIKKNASEEEGTEAIDMRYAHYETETEWVDIYAIEGGVNQNFEVKIVNTVTYTFAMLVQFFEDFSLENIDSVDFSTLDTAPMFEFIVRLLNLIIKILNGFGLEIDISSLIGG